MADAARVRAFENAPNATVVRRHKDGQVMRILLESHSEDYGFKPRYANPQKDVYYAETEVNPPRVWAFKKRPKCETAEGPRS